MALEDNDRSRRETPGDEFHQKANVIMRKLEDPWSKNGIADDVWHQTRDAIAAALREEANRR